MALFSVSRSAPCIVVSHKYNLMRSMREASPRTSPQNSKSGLPSQCFIGSLYQLTAPVAGFRMLADTSGIRVIHVSLAMPRSRSMIKVPGSSFKREAKTHPAVPPGHAAQASCRQIWASTDPAKVMTALAELAGLMTGAILAAPDPAQLGSVASAANPTSTTDSSAQLASAHFTPSVDPPLLYQVPLLYRFISVNILVETQRMTSWLVAQRRALSLDCLIARWLGDREDAEDCCWAALSSLRCLALGGSDA